MRCKTLEKGKQLFITLNGVPINQYTLSLNIFDKHKNYMHN